MEQEVERNLSPQVTADSEPPQRNTRLRFYSYRSWALWTAAASVLTPAPALLLAGAEPPLSHREVGGGSVPTTHTLKLSEGSNVLFSSIKALS